jgi:putative ABC transport system substrate-binding protein
VAETFFFSGKGFFTLMLKLNIVYGIYPSGTNKPACWSIYRRRCFSLVCIGILQLTQFLDDAVQGFKAGLEACSLAATLEYRNADGNLDHLPALALELKDRGASLIFACSTPSAQAAVALPGDIPVVFTPVFDPVGAGLAVSLARPGGKATGMAGMVPAAAKLAFIHALLPQAKTIGILYHIGDANSRVEVANFTAAAANFTLVPLALDNPEELSLLGDRLPPSLDLLFVPIGRSLEENFATISYYAEAAGLPIIASNPANVSAGALGALVADHYKLGYACATQVKDIFAGTLPAVIPIGMVEQPDILLNQFVADNLEITFPNHLAKGAKEIFD